MVDIIDRTTNEPVPDPNNKLNSLSYHIDKKLVKHLEKVKEKISKKDQDWVIVVDGYEGAGKSTLAQQIGKYIDSGLDLSRICMTADEFKQAIINASKGQCVIYDEAVTGMTAGDSITRIGRLLKSMMMQMRQKNLFVIVIIPTIFELGKYAILSRARGLFHVYESGGRRGYWVGYNRKDLRTLYIRGKKTYSYKVRSRFNGRFYGKWAVNEEEYRKKKAEALFKLDDETESESKTNPSIAQRDNLIRFMAEKLNIGAIKMERELNNLGVQLHKSQISTIISRNARKTPSSQPPNI